MTGTATYGYALKIHRCHQCGEDFLTREKMPTQCTKCWSKEWNKHKIKK